MINKSPPKKKKIKLSHGEGTLKLRQNVISTSKNNILKECPFCRGTAVAYETPWGAGVSCKSCNADGPNAPAPATGSINAVIKLWNKRH